MIWRVRASRSEPRSYSTAWGSRGLAGGSLGAGRALACPGRIRSRAATIPVDPVLVPTILWGKARSYLFLHRYGDGIECANKILLFQPAHMMGLINLVMLNPAPGREARRRKAPNSLAKAPLNLTAARKALDLQRVLSTREDHFEGPRGIQHAGPPE